MMKFVRTNYLDSNQTLIIYIIYTGLNFLHGQYSVNSIWRANQLIFDSFYKIIVDNIA